MTCCWVWTKFKWLYSSVFTHRNGILLLHADLLYNSPPHPKPWADNHVIWSLEGDCFLLNLFIYSNIIFTQFAPRGKHFSFYSIFVLLRLFSILLLIGFTGTGESKIIFPENDKSYFLLSYFQLSIIFSPTQYKCVYVCMIV